MNAVWKIWDNSFQDLPVRHTAEDFPKKREMQMHKARLCCKFRQVFLTFSSEKWGLFEGGWCFCPSTALWLCTGHRVRLFRYHWLPAQLWAYFRSTDGSKICQNWKYLLSYQAFSFEMGRKVGMQIKTRPLFPIVGNNVWFTSTSPRGSLSVGRPLCVSDVNRGLESRGKTRSRESGSEGTVD